MKIKSRIQSLKSDKLVLKIFDQTDKQSLKPKLIIRNTENLMLNHNKISESIELASQTKDRQSIKKIRKSILPNSKP